VRRAKSLAIWLLLIAIAAAILEHYGDRLPLPSRGRAPPATGEAISGRVRVVDGDSLEVAGRRIRLFGIDAPESPQSCADARGRDYACGAAARHALVALIGGRAVICTPVGESHDRDVAICRAGERDLSEAMIRAGHAIELRSHSRGRYSAAEREARAGKRGIWVGTFKRPGDWRSGREQR
jgi:endonuclease YncB( thermonuclease family)